MPLFNLLKTAGQVAMSNPKTTAGLLTMLGLAGHNLVENQLPDDQSRLPANADQQPLIPQQQPLPDLNQQVQQSQQQEQPIDNSPLLDKLRGSDIPPESPVINKFNLPPSEPDRNIQNAQSQVEPSSDFQNLLKKYLNQPAEKRNLELNLPDQSKDYEALYNKAKQESDSEKQAARFGKAVDVLGAGIIGANTKSNINPVMQDYFNERLKDAEGPLEDFKNKLALEKKDPNSAYSQGLKQFLTSYGVKVNGPLDAETAEKLIPNITKIYENDFNKQAQRQNLLIHLAQLDSASKDRALSRELSQQSREADRQTKQTDKEARNLEIDKQKLGLKLNEELASSRSPLGVATRNKQAVENAKALLAGSLDYNQLDNREVYELAKVLDRVLSQGNPTISGSGNLTPDTARGWLAKKLELVTNQRQGAGAADFVKRYEKTFDREGQVADKQIRRASANTLLGFKGIAQKDPEYWNLLLRSKGLPENLFESGKTLQDIDKENAPKMVQVRRKADGFIASIPEDQADTVLKASNKYEKVQ